MPNIAVVLKDEISRLARKEIRKEFKQSAERERKLKKTVSELRQRIEQLERAQGKLDRTAQKGVVAGAIKASEQADEEVRFWVTAKGIRALRAKLKLSQAELGKLIGVTGQTIYQWEHSTGKLNVRAAQRGPITDVRKMGVKDARKALSEMGVEKATRGPKPGSKNATTTAKKPTRGPGRPRGRLSPPAR